jgi:hypothetical protein
MRRWILSLVFALALSTQLEAAITFVTSTGASVAPASSTTAVITMGAALSTGDLIVVCGTTANGGGTDWTGVTDTLSNTYSEVVDQANVGDGTRIGMWLAVNGTGGTPVITITQTVSNNMSGAAGAFRGTHQSVPGNPSTCVASGADDGAVDACVGAFTDTVTAEAANHGATDGGTETALSITTGATTALVSCAGFSANGTLTVPTGYTNGGGALSGQRSAIAYNLDEAAGTYTFADGSAWATSSSNISSATSLIGVKEAAGGGGASGTIRRLLLGVGDEQ